MDEKIENVLENVLDTKKHVDQFAKLFKQFGYHVYGNIFDVTFYDFRSCSEILEELMTHMAMLRGPIAMRLHKLLSERMESDRNILKEQWGKRLNDVALSAESSSSLLMKIQRLLGDYEKQDENNVSKKQMFNLFQTIVETSGYQHADILLRELEIEHVFHVRKDNFRRLSAVNAFKLTGSLKDTSSISSTSSEDEDEDDDEEEEEEKEENDTSPKRRHYIHIARSHYESWCDTSDPTQLEKSFKAFVQCEKYRREHLLRSPQHLHLLLRVYYEHGAHVAALEIASRIIQDFPTYRNLSQVIFDAAALLRDIGKYKQSRVYLSYLTSQVPRGLTEALITMEIARSMELEIVGQNDHERDENITEREHGVHLAAYRLAFQLASASTSSLSSNTTISIRHKRKQSLNNLELTSASSATEDEDSKTKIIRRVPPKSPPPAMRQGFFHWYRSASTFYSHGMYVQEVFQL